MSKFNAQEVARVIASKSYTLFEYEVRGHVMHHFGVTNITAAKWVQRVIEGGFIRRTGQVAICLV
jgi:hypothetical protein